MQIIVVYTITLYAFKNYTPAFSIWQITSAFAEYILSSTFDSPPRVYLTWKPLSAFIDTCISSAYNVAIETRDYAYPDTVPPRTGADTRR